jgi:hypothetical protein
MRGHTVRQCWKDIENEEKMVDIKQTMFASGLVPNRRRGTKLQSPTKIRDTYSCIGYISWTSKIMTK